MVSSRESSRGLDQEDCRVAVQFGQLAPDSLAESLRLHGGPQDQAHGSMDAHDGHPTVRLGLGAIGDALADGVLVGEIPLGGELIDERHSLGAGPRAGLGRNLQGLAAIRIAECSRRGKKWDFSGV